MTACYHSPSNTTQGPYGKKARASLNQKCHCVEPRRALKSVADVLASGLCAIRSNTPVSDREPLSSAMSRQRAILVISTVAVVAFVGDSFGQQPPTVRTVVSQFCLGCHDAAEPKGG